MLKKSLNVRPYNNKELLLFPSSVGDYIPKDHLVHIVDEAVEEIDLEPYYKKISDVGNPPYHPALMIKIWFYGYCVQTYSSRKIEDKLHTDVAFIYLSGMQNPDFKAISEFRRKNLSELKNSFVDILQICHRLGMTKLGEISLDSKVMKANASISRTYNEKELIKERETIKKAIGEYLEKADQTDQEEDEKYGSDKRGNELPENIRNKEDRLKKMKQIAEQLKQAQQKLKDSKKEKLNLTDTDSQIQKDKGRKFPGYRAQAAVDYKQQVIVANDVTEEQSDTAQLVGMVKQVIENVEQLKDLTDTGVNDNQDKIKLSADSGYSSGKNLSEIQQNDKYEKNINLYIPDRRYQAKTRGKKTTEDSPFHKSKFIFYQDKNYVQCPEGKRLNWTGYKKERNGEIGSMYQCPGSICRSCKHFGKCTINKDGRTVQISENEDFLKQMRQKLSTPEGKQIYSKRSITVEPVLGNLSQNLGFREFLLRGKYKAKGEWSLMCTAHNLLKIAKFTRQLGLSLKEALAMPALVPVADTS